MQNLNLERLHVECALGSNPVQIMKEPENREFLISDFDSNSDFGYDTENDSASGTDSNDYPSTQPSSASSSSYKKTLASPYERHNIIVFTPDSSPLPSPTSDCNDTDAFSAIHFQPESPQQFLPAFHTPSPSSLHGMALTLDYLYSTRSPWPSFKPRNPRS